MIESAGSLDTNVLLRLFLNDVPTQHKSAVELFEKSNGFFAVADTAVIELVFILQRSYGFTRPEIVDLVNGLTRFDKINCNRPLFENALPIFTQHPKLSFEDCCLACYAKLNNAEPLWTFDKKLANQTKSAKLVA
jgi:predicted nucleic-acid-binding protein